MIHSKLIILSLIFLLFFSMAGCMDVTTSLNDETTSESTTSQSTTNPSTWDAYIPSYSNYDLEVFRYATVAIRLKNDHQDKTLFMSQSGLDHADYDELYLSTYTNLILLEYKQKTKLLDDFNLIQNIYLEGDIERPLIELKTIMKTFEMTATNTVDDLIEMSDQYFGTEITFDSIDYDMIEEIGLEMLPTSAYTTYLDYLDEYPNNRFELSASDFDAHVLLIISFGHSSSITIDSFDLFYVSDGILELAIIGTAMSIQMTEDFRPYSVVMMIPEEAYQNGSQIITHFHIHFLDGTYADRPYHNSIDDSR